MDEDRLSKETEWNKTDDEREAITEHLDEMEDVYLAQQVLERVRAGKEETIPLETLMQDYGLVGSSASCTAMHPGVED